MRGLWALALALAAALAWVGPSRAAAPQAASGNPPMIEQIAISPSGRLLAIAMIKDEQRTIVVEDLQLKKPVNGVRLGAAKLRGLEWAGDNHLIFLTSFTGGAVDFLTDNREWLVATDFNLAAHKLAPLLADANLALNAVAAMPTVRMIDGKPYAMAVGIYFGKLDEGAGMQIRHSELAIYKVALDVDRSSLVSDDGVTVNGYVLAADGEPAAESLFDPQSKQWELKVWQGGHWRVAQTETAGAQRPQLLGLGRDGRSILVRGLGDKANELREVSADGAVVSEPLPGPATGEPIHDPVDHRLIGMANFDGVQRSYHFYEDSVGAQWAAIEAAFPGQRVALVSSSDDRQRLILHLDSPTAGPGYALVDLATHSSQWLGAGPQ